MFLSFRTVLCILACVVLVTAQGSTKSTSRTSTTTSSNNKGRGRGRGGASSTSYTKTTTTTTTSSSRSGSSGSSMDDSFFDDFFSDAPPGSSFSSGSSSTSGSSGSGSTVYVRTSSSASSKEPNEKDEGGSNSKGKSKSKGRGRGKDKGSESRSVEVGEGTVSSSSSASGSGTVRASASATVTPGRERGTASTTVGGKTRTTEESRPRRESGSSTGSKRSQRKSSLPICRGLAKFKCCDDQRYYVIDDAVYCGCFGSGTKKDLCFYRRMSEDPLVIKDVFGANQGEECQCAPTDHEPCIGVMRKECCEGYNGKDPRCFCPDEDEHCHYEVISNDPLIWRDNRFGKTTCVC